jgi:hypothetical protein
MPNGKILNLISIISVKDQAKSESWYKKLLGREADLVPHEGVAEWKIVENAWLQVTTDPERAGYSTVVLGIEDIDQQRKVCEEIGISLGETVVIPELIKMIEIVDPDGNKVAFVQDLTSCP